MDVQAHRIGICSSSPRPDPPELGEAELEVGELDAAELTAEACAVPWARRRGKEAVEREGWRHPVLLLLPGSSSPEQSCCCPRREGRGGARREEGRACADPPPRDGLHRASPRRRGGSSAARGPRRRGARPPSMEGVEERRSPRGGRRAELAQIHHRAMASTAPRPVAVEGARPPAGRGGVEGLEECRSPRGGVPGRAEPCRRSGRRGAAGGCESQCR